jgi:hypothetical protein
MRLFDDTFNTVLELVIPLVSKLSTTLLLTNPSFVPAPKLGGPGKQFGSF